MKDYLKLLSFLKGQERLFFAAIAMMFATSLFEVFQLGMAPPMVDIIFNKKQIVIPNKLPDFLGQFVDYINQIPPETLFNLFPIILIIGICLKQVFAFLHQYMMSDVSQRIMRDARVRLYDKIQELSLDYFSKKRAGELISRVMNDVRYIENAVSYGLTDLFKQTFMLIMFIATAFVIYPKAALIVFAVFPLLAYPLSRIGKRLKKISQYTQEKMADLNTHLMESIQGVQLVKAFGTEEFENRRFRENNNAFYKLQMKSIKRMAFISPITEVIGAICGAAMFYYIGKPVLEGEVSLGVFVLFFGCIMSIISPIKKLGNVNALTQQALAANQRIYDVLESKPTVSEKEHPIELSELKKSIVYQHVDFQYDDESGIVLKDINLEVRKGELLAVVGPTGTGKTTLVSLIPRFYDPLAGKITFDGTDIKDVSFSSLRKQIGIVTQETILFNDTVRSNIAYGLNDVPQERTEEAARRAFAHRFIVNMPQGYDTVIGDRGFRLSGGEKQRLAIARAILRNPPILLLDEATSQLDSESERFVQDALDELMIGRTVVAIAHRLSTIKKADKIVVLENGRIVGLGTHGQLIETCDLYKKLHQIQFQV